MEELAKLVIFGDPRKKGVSEAIGQFTEFVKGKANIIGNFNVMELHNTCFQNTDTSYTEFQSILKACDFVVVFGGDGSFICAARFVSDANVPIIGVNVGKLGFLAEFSVDDLKTLFTQIIERKIQIEERIMLDCHVSHYGESEEDKKQFSVPAINDVYITAGPPFRMIELKIKVDGLPLVGCISDGLIISTPTGSTAYNLSAGGPIVSPQMDAIVITPVCPHSLAFRPIVIDSKSTIEVIGQHVNNGTTLSVDGQVSLKFAKNDTLKITKNSGSFLVVKNPLLSHWDTLAAKLGWGEKPKYNTT